MGKVYNFLFFLSLRKFCVKDLYMDRRGEIPGRVDRGIEGQVYDERAWDRNRSDARFWNNTGRDLKRNLGAAAAPAKYLRGNK